MTGALPTCIDNNTKGEFMKSWKNNIGGNVYMFGGVRVSTSNSYQGLGYENGKMPDGTGFKYLYLGFFKIMFK